LQTPSDSSQSVSKRVFGSPEYQGNTIIKYQEVEEDVIIYDKYSNMDAPLLERVSRLIMFRAFLT
jgi:hypothetical protein